MPCLLILTSNKDLAADFLISELLNEGFPYFRLNFEELTRADALFELGPKVATRRISLGPRDVDLNKVSAVWYRRAIQPIPETTMSPAERQFVAGELRHLFAGLILDPAIMWMNHIDRVSIAEHKIYQLRMASALGFCIPRSLISNNTSLLRDFVKTCSTGAICKPIYHGLFVEAEARYSIYTRRVTAKDFEEEGRQACPVLLQEEVPRLADVRVTLIGEKCFVAEIAGPEGMIDWRDPELNVRFAMSDIDECNEDRCRKMLGALGLTYGAFDFIKKPDGSLVFLELNPTGEWAWLEDRLGFRMRRAFTDTFFGSARCRT